MIASTGKQVSVGLLSVALQALGKKAVSYAGWQVPIKTDSAYTKARISSIDDAKVKADGRRQTLSSLAPKADDLGNITNSGRWFGYLRSGDCCCDEGARMFDLYRRRRRVHDRPTC